MENVIIVTECNAPWENEPTSLPSTSAATTWHRGKMTPTWENEPMMTLPRSLVRFLDTLGIADMHTDGNYEFKNKEPNF